MEIMEAQEKINGLTDEIKIKDGANHPQDAILQNGFVATEHCKTNGNHSNLLDGQGDKPDVDGDHDNLNNHVDTEVPKDQLKIEDENSTATSNLSDVSLYEDSEKSMDVGEGTNNDEKPKDYEAEKENKSNDIPQDDKMDIGEGTNNQDDEKPKDCETETENKSNVISQDDDKMDVDESSNEKDEENENIDSNGTGIKTGKEIVHDESQKDDIDNENKTNEGKDDNIDEVVESDKNSEENKNDCSDSIDNSPEEMETNDKNSKNNKSDIEEKSVENPDHSENGDKKMINETNSQNDKSETLDENKSVLKSVEKVTDIDGSEILITINEEHEESDNEENSAKNKKEEKKEENKTEKKPEKLTEDNISDKKDAQDIVTVEDSPQKLPEIAPKVNPPTSVVNIKLGSNIPGQPAVTTGQIRFPIMPGSLVQYGVQPTPQQKYINVGGQQILITVPSSSMGPALNTGNSFIAASPLMNVNMVAATFPPPNPNKNPLDKTIDIDVPQASWEQKELIKYEVMSRKPDNAFWGGLANLNKKADLSSVGKFLFDLGSDIVKESAYEQIVMVQKKKEDASQLSDTEKESLRRMKKVVEELKNKLKYLHDLPEKKCECGFTTDSANVMFFHKQYPHSPAVLDKNYSLDCAHCGENFQGKFAEEFFKAHLAKEHNTTAKFMIKPSYWPCNLCPFEGTNKNTLIKHQLKCQKNFKQHLNLAPHHVDINLSLKNIFYKYQVNNKKIQQAQIAAVERPDTRGNSLQNAQKSLIQNKQVIQPKPKPRPLMVNPNRPIIPTQFQQPQITGISASNSWQNNYSRILQTAANVQVEGTQYAQIQRPPPPIRPSTVNKPTVNQLLKTQQGSANRSGFEVCEICGGYVKDRMSLRIHFFYAHKIEMPAHVFSKPLAPLFCSSCNERFWTSQGFAKHKTSGKHLQNMKKMESPSNQCWICHQKPENLYSHLHKFHRLTTGECMALKRCMFCGIQSHTRKELELHMAATHGVLIKGDEKSVPTQPSTKPQANVSTKNLSTVVTGGTSGMVRNNFCVFCSAQFPDNTKLTLHCLSVHATCKKCGMVVNKSTDLARHVCKLSSKTCSICGLKNLKPAGLIKHLETHVKPCKVVLKRLNTSQIRSLSGGKNRRDSQESSPRDARLRSRLGLASSETSNNDGKASSNEKKTLTVALKFDKGKSEKEGKFSIVLDDSKEHSKDEVVIESDHDSDVIIEEEEKTEIILDDSDNDEEKQDKKEIIENQKESKKDVSESKSEGSQEEIKSVRNSDKSESEDEVDKCELKAESENIDQSDENETSNKSGKKSDKVDKSEDNSVENIENDDDRSNDSETSGKSESDDKMRKSEINSTESENVDDQSNDSETSDKSVKNSDNSESDYKIRKSEINSAESENVDDQSNDSETSDISKHDASKINENKEECVDTDATGESTRNEEEDVDQHETSNVPMEAESSVDRKSCKRSHSDDENSSDSSEETKRRKTDEDSDNS